MKHTATPWMEVRGRWVIPAAHAERKIGGSTDKAKDRDYYAACICITGDNPNRFAEGEPEANAAFIVRACNSHDKLVEALKRCVNRMTAELPDPQDIDELYFALETLAAAEKP